MDLPKREPTLSSLATLKMHLEFAGLNLMSTSSLPWSSQDGKAREVTNVQEQGLFNPCGGRWTNCAICRLSANNWIDVDPLCRDLLPHLVTGARSGRLGYYKPPELLYRSSSTWRATIRGAPFLGCPLPPFLVKSLAIRPLHRRLAWSCISLC